MLTNNRDLLAIAADAQTRRQLLLVDRCKFLGNACKGPGRWIGLNRPQSIQLSRVFYRVRSQKIKAARWRLRRRVKGKLTGEEEIASELRLPEAGIYITDGSFTQQPSTTAATPEPSSLILLGTASLGLFGAARRRFFSRS